MRLRSVTVRNFRNLRNVTVPFQPGTVVVGENGAGKSNLLFALRLALDPTLASSDRHLRREDFSDSLGADDDNYDPFIERAEIEVSVEFDGIGDDAKTLALLGAALIEIEPRRARIVYRYAPRDTSSTTAGRPRYDWSIVGGLSGEEEEVRGDVRRFLRVTVLSALRDVEGDIVYWRRSPLRTLLEAAAAELDDDALKELAESVTIANSKVLELSPIEALTEAITRRTTELVGEDRASPTSFGIAPTDPQRLLRALRLFTDEATRPLSSASLGTLNVLYLALLQLALDEEVRANDAAHIVLGIEEPEAHLHPHLQRLVFADVLRQRPDREQSVVVTTHSPHIVSVTPPTHLVILRQRDDGDVDVGVAAEAALKPREWDDIARYLDATRGELVFARRVLLVEGFAESVLLPKLAADAGIYLDKVGVTVCAIHGTHFTSYARYLNALRIPWAVVTDGDPTADGLAGEGRAQRLMKRLNLKGVPQNHGIFVGEHTFEPDVAMVSPGNGKAAVQILKGRKWMPANQKLIGEWERTGVSDAARYLSLAETFGKARLAQRLASVENALVTPAYIAEAFKYLLT